MVSTTKGDRGGVGCPPARGQGPDGGREGSTHSYQRPAAPAIRGIMLHIAAGTSAAAGFTVPALQADGWAPAAYRIAAYITWGVAFSILFILELLRHRDPLRKQLLGGVTLFCGLKLLGSLAQGASTMLEVIFAWGPLALTVSTYAVSVVIELVNPREAIALAMA